MQMRTFTKMEFEAELSKLVTGRQGGKDTVRIIYKLVSFAAYWGSSAGDNAQDAVTRFIAICLCIVSSRLGLDRFGDPVVADELVELGRTIALLAQGPTELEQMGRSVFADQIADPEAWGDVFGD